MKTLVIIGIERTGTNYLCSLLNQLPSVESRFELFANVAAISLTPLEIERIAAAANQPFQDKTDPTLIEYLKKNVEPTLALIQQHLLPHKQLLSFKIFREHLPQPVLRDLIQTHHVVFVTRTVIDTYISFMKALESKVWINRDTTTMKPELSIEHFAYWYRQTLQYYRDCVNHYQTCKQQAPVILQYRDFTGGTNIENLQAVTQQLHGMTGLEFTLPTADFQAGFYKQDQSQTIGSKVANWDDFQRQLQQKNLLNAALGSFLEM